MTSHWLQDIQGQTIPRPPLDEDISADVAIVGGGFVGLWTAIQLRQLDPSCSVVVIEQNRCGDGASGLNGGFVMSWWPKITSLRKICGDADAAWLADETSAAVRDLGSFLAAHGIDAEVDLGGWLWTATTPAHIGAWTSVLKTAAALGRDDVFQDLTPAEVVRRTGSPVHLAGIYEPLNGVVHPAKLARGLAAIATSLGVRLYENTRMQKLERGRPARVVTPHGTVTADTVVLTTNAWAASVPELASRFICVTSAIVATPPIPDRLAALGWTGHESITDSQTTVNYYRTTRSGRIIFGKGGGKLSFTGEPGVTAFQDRSLIAGALRDFRRVYPTLADVPIEQAWSGPIDRTQDGLPLLGALPQHPNILFGIGWSGNGVNPSRVGGRILAGLALERVDRWTRNGLVNRHTRRFPPEPLRYLGGNLVIGAVTRKDRADIGGRKASFFDRALSRLGPSGLEDK